MTPQYRIQQTSPATWELDRASKDGGWIFVGYFDSQGAAQNKMTECIAAGAWSAPPSQYYDAFGQATAEQK
jgi:hypothetical protein